MPAATMFVSLLSCIEAVNYCVLQFVDRAALPPYLVPLQCVYVIAST